MTHLLRRIPGRPTRWLAVLAAAAVVYGLTRATAAIGTTALAAVGFALSAPVLATGICFIADSIASDRRSTQATPAPAEDHQPTAPTIPLRKAS